MRAYVQQVKQDSSFYLASIEASHWFWERGYEVVPFRFQDIHAGLLDEWLLERADETVVRAGVEAIRTLLARAGRPTPPNFDLPDSLSPWICRFTWEILFAGSSQRTPPVLAQQRIEFVSEWRVSILRDKILNVANYKGNPLLFPDVGMMQSAIEAFTERPIAFGMDWGITASGQTLLVEVNDGYALGNYGLNGMPFTAMIEARWRQLMGLPDNGVGDCFTL